MQNNINKMMLAVFVSLFAVMKVAAGDIEVYFNNPVTAPATQTNLEQM